MEKRLLPVLADYRKGLEAIYGPRLKGAILFGSQARGDAGPDSDIDVMVVLDALSDDFDEIERTSALTMAMLRKYDVLVSRKFVSHREWAAPAFPFHANVAAEGIAF